MPDAFLSFGILAVPALLGLVEGFGSEHHGIVLSAIALFGRRGTYSMSLRTVSS